MKTRSIILTAAILGFFSLARLNAAPGFEKKAIENQLSQTLYSLVSSVPYGEIMGEENESNLRLHFKINDKHEITNISVEGENKRLARYIFNTLTKKFIKVDTSVDPKTYEVNVLFKTN